MTFKNPCKECLVRACCSITCQKKEDFEKHIDYLETPIIVISIIMAVVIIASLLVLFSQITYSKIDQWFLSSLIWFISFIIFALVSPMDEIKHDLKGEHFLKIIENITLIFTMLPIIIITFSLIKLCEKVIGSEIL